MPSSLKHLFVFLFVIFCVNVLSAQVIISSTGTAYTQNFNTLVASGTSAVLPTGWALLETGTNANTTYTADAGAATTGNTYSYGTGTGTDRGFGSLLSSSLIPTIGVQVRNSTGSTITSITITYTGEEWRCGATGRTDQLDFQYSTSATSLSTGTWIDINSLDFITPVTSTTGAKDGNAAANRTVKTATITGLSIPTNTVIWLRWKDFDATGADDGLAIDDVSITMTGADVTPPTSTAFSPANASINQALSGNLVLTFSENIVKGTAGTIDVKRTSDNVVVQSTPVTSATVTTSTNTATIPYSGLANSTSYYVNISAGAFKDAAGNSYAGIATTNTWAFTTVAPAAPSVSVNPTSLSFGNVLAGNVSATQTFSFSTANFTGGLILTAPAGFIISRDGASFTASVVYTLAEAQAGQTVSVKFTPTTANTNYSGLINFSSTGLNTNLVTLSGNSNTGASGPLNFYYGNLHAHSSYSDGNADNTTKIPADDYAYAKTSLCLDFLGISEHNHATAGMNIANWPLGRAQAAAATTSAFVGMYGMEWGVISGGGHVLVYGVDSLVGWEAGNYQIFVQKNVYTGSSGIFNIINRHGNNALATLAHPNSSDYNNIAGIAYDAQADAAIVGSAVESGPAFSLNTTYTDPATSMSYLTYYKTLLAKGYHLGPTIDHDNHNMTFGHTAKTRLVVLASSLSEATLLEGMRNMRFYASQDCGARITYTLNTQPMGSILTQAGAPTINVSSVTTAAVSSVVIMGGVPGSGLAATALATFTSGSFTYTDNTLANLGQRYYYLDITEVDGKRIVTSPIWYTRNDAARFVMSDLTSLFTINDPNSVTVKWTTDREEPGQYFEVERSTDGGNTYHLLTKVTGRGDGMHNETYSWTDVQPYTGTTLYRLVQRRSDLSQRYSDTRMVSRGIVKTGYLSVYPNPVEGILTIKVSAQTTANSIAEILDMSGRRILAKPILVGPEEQAFSLDMSRLGSGTYLLKLMVDGKMISRLVNKL